VGSADCFNSLLGRRSEANPFFKFLYLFFAAFLKCVRDSMAVSLAYWIPHIYAPQQCRESRHS